MPWDFTAVITAAGQSRRYGSDKALALLHGLPLIQHAASALHTCPHHLLIAPTGKYHLPGWTVIPDLRPGLGPLAGLETALTHSPTPWIAFTAVDLPHLTPHDWQTLADTRSPTTQAIIAINSQKQPQPLIALYHTSLLPHITQLLDQGERRLRLAHQPHTTTYHPGIPDPHLHNINTPNDLDSTPPASYTP